VERPEIAERRLRAADEEEEAVDGLEVDEDRGGTEVVIGRLESSRG
jgi:hypothetical protein